MTKILISSKSHLYIHTSYIIYEFVKKSKQIYKIIRSFADIFLTQLGLGLKNQNIHNVPTKWSKSIIQ